jgi:hypothetical protein
MVLIRDTPFFRVDVMSGRGLSAVNKGPPLHAHPESPPLRLQSFGFDDLTLS